MSSNSLALFPLLALMFVFLLSLVVVEGMQMQMQMKEKVACNNGTSVGECLIEAEEEWSFDSETARRMLAGGTNPIAPKATIPDLAACDGTGGKPYTQGGGPCNTIVNNLHRNCEQIHKCPTTN